MSMSGVENDKPLSNLNVLITGASSGIGKATSILLTEKGATVIGVGRNEKALEEMKSNGELHGFIVMDLLKEKRIASKWVMNEALSMLPEGRKYLTTLINNAGLLNLGGAGSFNCDDNSPDDDPKKNGNTKMVQNYHDNMTLNTQIPYELMNYAIPHLEKHNSSSPGLASIVNISSVNGKQSFEGCIAYCMSKAALDMMTRCASVDLASKGIRVNSVNPGVITTNLHKGSAGMNDDRYDSFLKRCVEITHPMAKSLGRCGTSEEVAELICFLVSDKAKFISGECIAIDGARQNLGSR